MMQKKEKIIERVLEKARKAGVWNTTGSVGF